MKWESRDPAEVIREMAQVMFQRVFRMSDTNARAFDIAVANRDLQGCIANAAAVYYLCRSGLLVRPTEVFMLVDPERRAVAIVHARSELPNTPEPPADFWGAVAAALPEMDGSGGFVTDLVSVMAEGARVDRCIARRECPKCGAAGTFERMGEDPRQAGALSKEGHVWVNYRCSACGHRLDSQEPAAKPETMPLGGGPH